ncbi:MAG: flavin reductase family protein [Lachnospiraceae bacterium]|nr:flavin reductase family protein [Lachnospiraceae bacterium]
MGKQYWKPGNMLYPVPAVMVSCGRKDEKPNIITVAWTSTSCSSPAMVSISIRPERYSYDIIKETGEFVVNLVNEELVYAADYCGVRSGRDVDKFDQMKLTPLESKTVKAPGISESPVNIECKVVQIIPLGSHDLFLGEVTGVTVDDKYMDETGRFDLSQAKLAVYSHGEYFGLGEKIGRFGYSVAKKKTAGKKDRQAAGKQPGAKSRMTAEKQSGLKKQKTAGNRQSRQRGQNRKTTGQ